MERLIRFAEHHLIVKIVAAPVIIAVCLLGAVLYACGSPAPKKTQPDQRLSFQVNYSEGLEVEA